MQNMTGNFQITRFTLVYVPFAILKYCCPYSFPLLPLSQSSSPFVLPTASSCHFHFFVNFPCSFHRHYPCHCPALLLPLCPFQKSFFLSFCIFVLSLCFCTADTSFFNIVIQSRFSLFKVVFF